MKSLLKRTRSTSAVSYVPPALVIATDAPPDAPIDAPIGATADATIDVLISTPGRHTTLAPPTTTTPASAKKRCAMRPFGSAGTKVRKVVYAMHPFRTPGGSKTIGPLDMPTGVCEGMRAHPNCHRPKFGRSRLCRLGFSRRVKDLCPRCKTLAASDLNQTYIPRFLQTPSPTVCGSPKQFLPGDRRQYKYNTSLTRAFVIRFGNDII